MPYYNIRDGQDLINRTVGDELNLTTGAKHNLNPDWFGLSKEIKAELLIAVGAIDRNVYDAPSPPKVSSLRADLDRSSEGNASARSIGFVRTPYSKWWNRTVLDYALPPDSPLLGAPIKFSPTELTRIGLQDDWPFDVNAPFLYSAARTIQTEHADRTIGLLMEPGFGISFPVGTKTLGPVAVAAMARFDHIVFHANLAIVRMRLCTPPAGANAVPATAIEVRQGSPAGELVARVPLPVSTATAHCGYIPGSYWLPGVMNDDPNAMVEVTAPLTVRQSGTKQLFLSLVGGYAAVDWMRFEAAV